MKRITLPTAALPFVIAMTLAASQNARADLVYTLDGQANLQLWNTNSLTLPVSGAPVRAVSQPGGPLSVLFVRDIDFRPSNGRLYAVHPSGLYIIDTATGVATLIGPFGAAVEPASMDFDPVTDELRIVGIVAGNRRNLRVNPDTGALISDDSGFSDAANPSLPVSVDEIAYSNNVPGAPAGSTRLFATYIGGQPPFTEHFLGEVGSQAGGQISFNTGAVNDVGATGLSQFGGFTPGGFDISGGNVAYHVYSVGSGLGRTQHLVTLNLATGQFSAVGQLGNFFSAASNVGVAAVPPPPGCPGDVNDDARVDAADLSILLSTFGASVTPGAGADINSDGIINAADLGIMLSTFGFICG